jgi:hypothetical protein
LAGLFVFSINKQKNLPVKPFPDDGKYQAFEFPENIKEKALQRLNKIKTASLYENITDGPAIIPKRNISDTIQLLKETGTDLIFRGFFRWRAPDINNPRDISPELLKEAKKAGISEKYLSDLIGSNGYYYDKLKENIVAIKKEIPDIIFTGAIAAQRINRIEYNPINEKVINADDVWGMSLDPAKWNVSMNGKGVTREEFQAWFAGFHQWTKEGGSYDKNKVEAYYPDITNPDFQELFLSFAKKQIDSGADAIWIDGLHGQSALFYLITKDSDNIAIKEADMAAAKIVDEIHEYGLSKGKYVYVGSWIGLIPVDGLPNPAPKLDFLTISPTEKEIEAKNLDKNRWDKEIANAKRIYGNVPVFSFIDWSFDASPLVSFSQKLTADGQKGLLKYFDDSFGKMGVNFVYPIHGGYIGSGELTKKLSFGNSRIYDSLAPEFGVYGTIKELSDNKHKK